MRSGGVARWMTAMVVWGSIMTCSVPRPALAEATFPNSLMSVSAGVVYETFVDEEDGSGLALGGEYERRLSQWWGVGVLAEFTSETRDFLLAVPVSLHFWRGARLIGAPAIELGEPKVGAVRTGLGYDWETADGHSIGFEFFVDFLEDDRRTFVLGLSAGKIF